MEQALARYLNNLAVFSISGRVPGRLAGAGQRASGLRNYRCRSYARCSLWRNVMPSIWLSKNIHILQSDWFSALAGQQFAMIVSNPPYIDEQDPHLQQGDVRFEPLTALVAADSGMADIVHIIEQSRNALVSGGFLLLEHGWQQG